MAPYQVNYGDVCGGVLIDHFWALTTAHCGIELTYIRIGSRHRLNGPKVTIDQHLVHPEYGEQHAFDFDVQLLRFQRRLHFSEMVSMIRLSNGECGDNVIVTGWGYSVEKGDYKDILQRVKVPLVSMQECQKVNQFSYNHTLTPRMFCAGGEDGDACQGDSGGAAVSYGKLVGLSSFGFGCGRGIPGVYTNISDPQIAAWIRMHAPV
ncbi:trypsin-7-like [Battus philenor]|uniref:trypsin-7-like n=1 Tax=Battus philenor TaxID=42288 RepID=UPI0035D05791